MVQNIESISILIRELIWIWLMIGIAKTANTKILQEETNAIDVITKKPTLAN